MARCAAGHSSAATDYCDVCGVQMDAPSGTGGPSGHDLPAASRTGQPELPCPRCGAPALGRFCEVCGYAAGSARTPPAVLPTVLPEPGAPAAWKAAAVEPTVRWTATAAASRPYYDKVMAEAPPDAGEVAFPDECPPRTFALTGDQMRIGRRSVSREVAPEIDLTGPPRDPGISRLHAVLLAQPDGSWAVVDPGSENGTTVNGTELAAGESVLLADGDQICVGAWTCLTIVAARVAED